MSSKKSIPGVFLPLMECAEMADELTPEILETYLTHNIDAEDFLPDLAQYIPLDALIDLIVFMGGKEIRLPTMDEVLSSVRSTNDA